MNLHCGLSSVLVIWEWWSTAIPVPSASCSVICLCLGDLWSTAIPAPRTWSPEVAGPKLGFCAGLLPTSQDLDPAAVRAFQTHSQDLDPGAQDPHGFSLSRLSRSSSAPGAAAFILGTWILALSSVSGHVHGVFNRWIHGVSKIEIRGTAPKLVPVRLVQVHNPKVIRVTYCVCR